jgi:hypothetical protein
VRRFKKRRHLDPEVVQHTRHTAPLTSRGSFVCSIHSFSRRRRRAWLYEPVEARAKFLAVLTGGPVLNLESTRGCHNPPCCWLVCGPAAQKNGTNAPRHHHHAPQPPPQKTPVVPPPPGQEGARWPTGGRLRGPPNQGTHPYFKSGRK